MDEKENKIMKIFKNIYEKDIWLNLENKELKQTESKSGAGSTLFHTITVRNKLPEILKKLNVKIFMDAPCGDFNWMKEIDLSDIYYIGIDIVPTVIFENIRKYPSNNRQFLCLDIISNNLPKSDIILCRDCLVHLTKDQIFKAIKNFKNSKSTYLLLTTFVNGKNNILNKEAGEWSPYNFQICPFNFPEPILVINENFRLFNNEFNDKSLALWKLEDLNF